MTAEPAPRDPASTPAPAPACLNCQTPLAGRFCHQCGQEGRSSLLSLRQLLAEVVHEVLDLEGKVVRSLGQLLFRPGRMTEAYIEGKRVRYVSPLRMYLLASVVLVAAGAGFSSDGVAPVPRNDAAKAAESREATTGTSVVPGVTLTVTNDPASKAALKRATEWLSTVFMVLPPVLALVMMGLYRRRKLPYSAHLYLALHLQAFANIVFAVDLLLSWPLYWMFGAPPTVGSRAVKAVLMFAVVVHILIAVRRVYGLRWPAVLVRTLVVMFIYLVAAAAVAFATVRVATMFTR